MKKIKSLALLTVASIMISALTAVVGYAKETNVNVALGKYVTSSKFGGGSWDGSPATVDALVDGGKEIYVSPLPEYGTDVITIDLLGDYTVTGVEVDTYGNDDPSDQFYLSDSTLKVVAKKTKSDTGVELTRKMNGDSGYFPYAGGGYHSDFSIDGSEKYRYIEVTYTEGAGAVDMRMPEIRVFAPANEAQNEEEKRITPISFGKSVTAGCSATWGSKEGVTDRNVSSNYYAYNRTDGEAWVIIDIGYAYPITRVVPDMQVGGVAAVLASNVRDFSEAEYLDDDGDGVWTIDEGIDNNFRYIKVIPTVAQSSATDTKLSSAYKEVIVYTTFDAKEELTFTDISKTAVISTNGNDQFWNVSQAVDGDEETNAGLYAANNDQYIQADFGRAQDIRTVQIVNANEWGWVGTGKVTNILLSNDPNFGSYVEMLCSGRIAPSQHADYVDHKSEWMYLGNDAYRYMRLKFKTGDLCYAQFSETNKGIQCFIMKEMYVCATEESAALQNVIQNKSMTVTGGAWYGEFVGANLVDNNNTTIAASGNGLAVFELDYPMQIKRVEIDLRADMIDSDNDRRFEIFLSNSGTTDGALQLMTADAPQEAVKQNTIVVPVDSEERYKYILIGSSKNFWVLSEARVMTNDFITDTVYTRQFSDDPFDAGETQTFIFSYRSPENISMTVCPIIARYDNDKLTDVVFGEVTNLSGNEDGVLLDYTLDSEKPVDDTTVLKGFIWEADENGISSKPICRAKTK